MLVKAEQLIHIQKINAYFSSVQFSSSVVSDIPPQKSGDFYFKKKFKVKHLYWYVSVLSDCAWVSEIKYYACFLYIVSTLNSYEIYNPFPKFCFLVLHQKRRTLRTVNYTYLTKMKWSRSCSWKKIVEVQVLPQEDQIVPQLKIKQNLIGTLFVCDIF